MFNVFSDIFTGINYQFILVASLMRSPGRSYRISGATRAPVMKRAYGTSGYNDVEENLRDLSRSHKSVSVVDACSTMLVGLMAPVIHM
jgi:hypothetical protein